MVDIELVSHCCFRLTMGDGTTIITDPWLNSVNVLRSAPLPYHWRSIPKCDIVLVSHNHLDHLDRSGLHLARKHGSNFVGAQSAVARARRHGIWHCISLEAGESHRIEDVRITATPTEHYMSPDGVGFLIEYEGRKIYFSGDTNVTKGLHDTLIEAKPDIMIVQMRASYYIGRKEGMDLEDAAQLVRDVGPEFAIPMHYHERTKTDNPERFRVALEGDPVEAVILEPGKSRRFFEKIP